MAPLRREPVTLLYCRWLIQTQVRRIGGYCSGRADDRVSRQGLFLSWNPHLPHTSPVPLTHSLSLPFPPSTGILTSHAAIALRPPTTNSLPS